MNRLRGEHIIVILSPTNMIRFGLCCLFREQPIKFRTTTATSLKRLARPDQLRKLSSLCLENSRGLLNALHYLQEHGIGAFRINSQFFPRYTHPEVGYEIDRLPEAAEIRDTLARCKDFKRRNDIRLSFHPDQFIVLSSPDEKVVSNSMKELEYHAAVAVLVDADVINIHLGGGYGDKVSAKNRFRDAFTRLSDSVTSRLSVENDDRTYTVEDLLPLCDKLSIPLAYDVHHHRCNPDNLTVDEATRLAAATWSRLGREPYFHVSSPLHGWGGKDPKPHHDFINSADFPGCWIDMKMNFTVDIEAKAKEVAIRRLMKDLKNTVGHGRNWGGKKKRHS